MIHPVIDKLLMGKGNIYKALIYFNNFYDKMDESKHFDFVTILFDDAYSQK